MRAGRARRGCERRRTLSESGVSSACEREADQGQFVSGKRRRASGTWCTAPPRRQRRRRGLAQTHVVAADLRARRKWACQLDNLPGQGTSREQDGVVLLDPDGGEDQHEREEPANAHPGPCRGRCVRDHGSADGPARRRAGCTRERERTHSRWKRGMPDAMTAIAPTPAKPQLRAWPYSVSLTARCGTAGH